MGSVALLKYRFKNSMLMLKYAVKYVTVHECMCQLSSKNVQSMHDPVLALEMSVLVQAPTTSHSLSTLTRTNFTSKPLQVSMHSCSSLLFI